MHTIPQVYTASHTVAFDAALRDARAQLPRTADARRADRGLELALNGAVTLHSTTVAHVTSASDPEVRYHVHARGGCDRPDGARRLLALADAAPGQRGCKHWYAAVCTALAQLNLALKGYMPEAVTTWYPAVALDEMHYGLPVRATEPGRGVWWIESYNGQVGYYTDVHSLELWERTPEHVTAWTDAVRSWERWLSAR
jgi:hypothetical protein